MKIDMHVHSSGISVCGQLSPQELAELYSKTSFDAIVLTNHYSRFTVDHRASDPKQDFYKLYQEEFCRMKEAGERYGLKVFCGYELRFDSADNDYLVYGLPECLAQRYEELFTMTPENFSALAKEHGFLFYQAHPFRNSMKIIKPEYLFGIEVQNGLVRHDSRNDIAKMWAEKFHLHAIAGSDCHQLPDVGRNGIETSEKVETLEDLLHVLKNDLYTIF